MTALNIPIFWTFKENEKWFEKSLVVHEIVGRISLFKWGREMAFDKSNQEVKEKDGLRNQDSTLCLVLVTSMLI